jgi:hypothetical protein
MLVERDRLQLVSRWNTEQKRAIFDDPARAGTTLCLPSAYPPGD